MTKSTLLHLRVPFSYFLTPVFLLALTVSPHPVVWKTVLAFLIIHLLIYPASNSFNSYYDRDKDSIGALKKPPPVNRELIVYSLVFEGIGIFAGFLISWQFALGLFLYGLASKAYSHDRIRLKKRPFGSWIGTALVQGAFTFLLVVTGVDAKGWELISRPDVLFAAILTSLFLMASYPMTQVYQHREDKRRGDITLSLLLGVRGTFLFTAVFFSITTVCFLLYYYFFRGVFPAVIFLLCQAPVLTYFLFWFGRVRGSAKAADYTSAMRLNLVSSTMLDVFCVIILFFFR